MPQDRSHLVVGLGNPGPAYRHTRHNVGFMVIDSLASKQGIVLNQRRFANLFGVGTFKARRLILAKPMTFMNLSGPAVRHLADSFRLDTKHLLVIHDDIDLVFGRIKIKMKGGDGGHNGVMSLIEAFGDDSFVRVRFGIGRPDTKEAVKGYVLDRFDAGQQALLEDVVSSAQGAVETILIKGVPEAMNQFHGRTISESHVGRNL
jgi:PTH1 family peptidyl-tRNA hydrolase